MNKRAFFLSLIITLILFFCFNLLNVDANDTEEQDNSNKIKVSLDKNIYKINETVKITISFKNNKKMKIITQIKKKDVKWQETKRFEHKTQHINEFRTLKFEYSTKEIGKYKVYSKLNLNGKRIKWSSKQFEVIE